MHMNLIMALKDKDTPIIKSYTDEQYKEFQKLANQMDRNIDPDKFCILDSMTKYGLFQKLNSFSETVYKNADKKLAFYSVELSDDCEVEFESEEKELNDEFHTPIDCLKFPNGTISPVIFNTRYIVTDNEKVAVKRFGKLQTPKVTKKSKRIKYLKNFDFSKVISKDKYAERFCSYDYNEETNEYGYYYNPYCEFDYAFVGGRWPCKFIIKEEVDDWVRGDIHPEFSTKAPDGYKFTTAARVKDIEWEVMREFNKKILKKEFDYLSDIIDNNPIGYKVSDYKITEEGIINRFSRDIVLKKGETLEDYYERNNIDSKYPFIVPSPVGIITDNDFQKYEYAPDDMSYKDFIEDIIDGYEDNDILISIDCHY